MPIRYLKRYTMEIDMREVRLPSPVLPEGYQFRSWQESLRLPHAEVTAAAFRETVDCELFPRLADIRGCLELMDDIAEHNYFIADATWLIEFTGNEFVGPAPCAAVQGLGGCNGTGAIQNMAVAPEHQGCGLGRALLLRALHGFVQRRVFRVSLEASAANSAALHLYDSIGFRYKTTSYREMPAAVLFKSNS